VELLGKSREALKATARPWVSQFYRADQIYHWLYAEREFCVGEVEQSCRRRCGKS